MAHFIKRVAAYVLRAIAIEVQEGSLIAVQRWGLECLQGELSGVSLSPSPWPDANVLPPIKPAPIVAAPPASAPLFKNEWRLL